MVNWTEGVKQVIQQFQDEDDDFIKSYKIISPFTPQTAQEQNISTTQFGHKLTIEVDIIEEELKFHLYIPSVISKDSKFLLLYKGKQQDLTSHSDRSDEISIVKSYTREAIQFFHQMRESFIEQYNDEATPTPGTGIKATQDFFEEDEMIEEVIMDDTEDSSVGNLNTHSSITNALFGTGTVSVIKDLDNLRLRILPDDLSIEMKKMYRLWETQNEPIVLSIQFAPDYTLNPKIPDIQYKPEKEKTGFGEQIQNICRKFLEDRWKSMNQFSSVYFDPIFQSELAIYRKARKDQIEMIKRFIKSKRNHIAMALSVYYSSFNPMEASVLFLESGGNQSSMLQESDGKINIVLELITYLYLRMIEMTTNCCICDRQIMIPFTKMHPTVCTSFKCSFDYVELKICSSIPIVINPITIHNDIAENEDIVDLLISLTYSCAASNRRDVIFDPFPEFFSNKNSKNFDAVVKQLDKMPSVAEMKQKKSEKELKEFLGEKYQLLCWILTCCRPAMLRLPEKKRFKEMNTEHQYMMLVDSPEKTSAFNTARKKYGSYFAFHGSALENWSPILRKGLVNASNTKLMTTGAVYGPGVYMAPDSGTSLGYARVGGSIWRHSKFARFESNLQCLAVCEVVRHPDVPQTPNPYYVVQKTEYITTRYFFFYAGTSVSIQAKDVDFHKFVTDAKK